MASHYDYRRSDSFRDQRGDNSRVSLKLDAQIKQVDILMFRTRLEDLSRTGFRVACPFTLRSERPLMIKIDGLEMLAADIRWSDGKAYGCQFRQGLHEAVFDHILRVSRAQGFR
jgi:hypothetical protein